MPWMIGTVLKNLFSTPPPAATHTKNGSHLLVRAVTSPGMPGVVICVMIAPGSAPPALLLLNRKNTL
jgi:hypothetical protein